MPQERHHANQNRTSEAAEPTATELDDDSDHAREHGNADQEPPKAAADRSGPCDGDGEQGGERNGGSDGSGDQGHAPDLDALASQTLDIWHDYLSASMSDPEAQEMMRNFLAMAVDTVRNGMRSGFAPDQTSGWPSANWMNSLWPRSTRPESDERETSHGANSGENRSPSAGAAPDGGASGDRMGADDELAARVAQLERRLRDLEIGPLPKAG